MLCSKNSVKWIVLVSLVSLLFLAFSSAHAEITLSSTNVEPGDTIYFSGDACLLSGIRYFLSEPSHSYIENPSFFNVTKTKDTQKCSWSDTAHYLFNGSIKLPEDLVPGEYAFVIDSYSKGNDLVLELSFNVSEPINKEWKYGYPKSTDIKNNNWVQFDYNDSSWNTGSAPFGDGIQFSDYVNTKVSGSIFIRKHVYLEEYQPMLLMLDGENSAECFVNGNSIGSIYGYQMYHHMNRCSDPAYINYMYQGSWDDRFFYEDGYSYKGYKTIDISPYLKKGDNIISCKASVDSDVIRRTSGYNVEISGRLFLDVQLRPLQKNDVLWTKVPTTPWKNSTAFASANFYDYSCVKWSWTGGEMNYYQYRYLGYLSSSFYWSQLPISDQTLFNIDPNRYWQHGKWKDAVLAYNKSTTYLKKYVWSDDEHVETLLITDTKQSKCYANSEQLTVENYNDDYWRYSASARLVPGVNVIACESSAAGFNYFNMDLVAGSGQLKISDVTVVNQTTDDITVKVRIENIAHPEVELGVVAEVQKDGNVLWSNSTKVYQAVDNGLKIVNKTLVFPYTSAWIPDPVNWTAEGNFTVTGRYPNYVSTAYRAFDNNWNSEAVANSTEKTNLTETYQIDIDFSEYVNTELKNIDYHFYAYNRLFQIEIFNYNSDEWETVYNFEHTQQSCANRIGCVSIPTEVYQNTTFQISANNDYRSADNKLSFRMPNYIKFAESEMRFYMDLYRDIPAEEYDSYAEVLFTLPLHEGPGTYDLIFSAADLKDGDADFFATQVTVSGGSIIEPLPGNETNDTSEHLGFYPMSGNSGNSNGDNNNPSIGIIALAAGIIGGAAVGIYFVGTSRPDGSISLTKLGTSLDKVSNSLSTLWNMSSESQSSNYSSFSTMINTKYQAFQKFITKLNKEKQDYLDWQEEQRRKHAQNMQRIEAEQFLRSLEKSGMSINQQLVAINDYAKKNGASETLVKEFYDLYNFAVTAEPLSQALLNNPYSAAAELAKAMEFKQKYAAQLKMYGLDSMTIDQLYKSGLLVNTGSSYIFNQQLVDVVIAEYQTQQQESQQNVCIDPNLVNAQNLADEDISDKSWWDKFTGALSGLGKLIVNSIEEKVTVTTGIISNLVEGDVSSAAAIFTDYMKDQYELLKDTIINHGVEIAIGIAIGVGIIVFAPIVIPALALALGVSAAAITGVATVAGLAIAGTYVVTTYGPKLNEINDTCTWGNPSELCQYNVDDAKQQILTDGLIIGGSLVIGGPLSEVVNSWIFKTRWGSILADAATKGLAYEEIMANKYGMEWSNSNIPGKDLFDPITGKYYEVKEWSPEWFEQKYESLITDYQGVTDGFVVPKGTPQYVIDELKAAGFDVIVDDITWSQFENMAG
jgi:hypothetical protein